MMLFLYFCTWIQQTKMNNSLDRASFEIIFRKEFQGMVFFAQKYVKDFDTAREIAQDSFLQLWEKRETIDTSRQVKSYLSTIIFNKCQNYLRDNRKFNSQLLAIEDLNFVDDNAYSDLLVEAELSEKINRVIELLPEKCKEIFILNRYENLKYQEIAAQLNISIKTVEAQMSKALQHMRLHLAEYILSLLYLLLHIPDIII